jgi:DNA-binding beta-propeller fold protein YncE
VFRSQRDQPLWGLCYDGANIWVANASDTTVTELNATSGATIGTYNEGGTPSDVCFDGSSIWVAIQGNGKLNKL